MRPFQFNILLAYCMVVFVPIAVSAGERSELRETPLTDRDRDHWSYQPLVKPTLPNLKHFQVPSNAIDHFILARLEKENLKPLPNANRVTLIRRLKYTLHGLPPTWQEVMDFVEDKSENAYEKVVDRLLADRAYGERWAQHWLDVARYAETDGFEHDKVRKNSWKYRDWVIEALNKDMPYDEFVRLQIAGDEIHPDNNGTHVATGFLFAGPDMPDLNLIEERKHVVLNEMTSAVGSVFLGLTLECAQCHNHKFDAISQADFYRTRAIFENAVSSLKKNQQLPASARETQAKSPKSYFIKRGDFRNPGPEVQPAFVRVINPQNKSVKSPPKDAKSSQRRLALANWLTSSHNPLTARVIVNRVWMHHFGDGFTNTPNDFGVMGDDPSHPALLDWLACDLMEHGWSLKHLHKRIVMSDAYKRASRPSDALWTDAVSKAATIAWQESKKRDPENRLLARRKPLRMDGEAIRDALLKIAGKLSNRRGGPGVRPPLPPEIVSTLLRNQWGVSKDEEDHYRRSIYIFARRNLRFPIFEAFDRPDANASCGRRSQSTTAPQALILFNSKFSHLMSAEVAKAATQSSKELRGQIHFCFQEILNRVPTDQEVELSMNLVQSNVSEQHRLNDLCLALFNLNEFVFVD